MKKPLAIVAPTKLPCHVCNRPTAFRRSMNHLNGPPTDPKDITPICADCDWAWTTAVFMANRPQ